MDNERKIKELEKEIELLRVGIKNDSTVEAIKQIETPFEDVQEWNVGDIIRFKLAKGKNIESQCQKVDEEGAIFCFTHCFKERRMNKESTNKGGWDASDLREYLNTKILNAFPNTVRERMVPIYEEDLLTLPSIEDIFGKWDYEDWKPRKRATPNWSLMKGVQYKSKGVWYWTRSVYERNTTAFLIIDGDGYAFKQDANIPRGLLPAYRITNLK